MHDFDARPGDPNSIAPGKRPLSNMAPTLLLKDGEPFLVAGSAAGPRIVTATLQTILNVVDHSLDIQKAVDAPRIHYQGAGAIRMESRIGPSGKEAAQGAWASSQSRRTTSSSSPATTSTSGASTPSWSGATVS